MRKVYIINYEVSGLTKEIVNGLDRSLFDGAVVGDLDFIFSCQEDDVYRLIASLGWSIDSVAPRDIPGNVQFVNDLIVRAAPVVVEELVADNPIIIDEWPDTYQNIKIGANKIANELWKCIKQQEELYGLVLPRPIVFHMFKALTPNCPQPNEGFHIYYGGSALARMNAQSDSTIKFNLKEDTGAYSSLYCTQTLPALKSIVLDVKYATIDRNRLYILILPMKNKFRFLYWIVAQYFLAVANPKAYLEYLQHEIHLRNLVEKENFIALLEKTKRTGELKYKDSISSKFKTVEAYKIQYMDNLHEYYEMQRKLAQLQQANLEQNTRYIDEFDACLKLDGLESIEASLNCLIVVFKSIKAHNRSTNNYHDLGKVKVSINTNMAPSGTAGNLIKCQSLTYPDKIIPHTHNGGMCLGTGEIAMINLLCQQEYASALVYLKGFLELGISPSDQAGKTIYSFPVIEALHEN